MRGNWCEALENLKTDHKFLTADDVFDKDFIESWIDLKMADVNRFEMTPHPAEYEMYYSV